MMTTIATLLAEVSVLLGETTTDVSTARVTMANRAFRHVFQQYSWSFRRKSITITTTAGVQDYDLTNISNVPDGDYDPEFGLYQIWNGTTKLDPVLYEKRSDYTSIDSFTISPDNKTLSFTSTQTSPTAYTIWYYSRHIDSASSTTTMKTSVPESFLLPLGTYVRHLIHERKRQRNDARNMILDFQEQIADLKMSQGKSKAVGLKRNIPTPIQYARLRRRYNY